MKKFIFCAITIALMALVHFCGQTPKNETPAKAVDGSKTIFELIIPKVKFETTVVPIKDTVVEVVAVQIRKQHVLRDTVVLKDTIRVPIPDTLSKTVVQRDTVYVSDTIRVPVMDVATVTTGAKVDSVVDGVQKTPKLDTIKMQKVESAVRFAIEGSVALAYSADSINRSLGSTSIALVKGPAALAASWSQRGFTVKQLSIKVDKHLSIGTDDSTARWGSPARSNGTAGDYRSTMVLSREGNMAGSLPDSIANKIKGIDMRALAIAMTHINYHRQFKGGGLEVSLHPLIKAARIGVRFNKGAVVASAGVTALIPTNTFNAKASLGVVKKSWSVFSLNEAVIVSKKVTARGMLHAAYMPTPKLKAQAWGCMQYGSGLRPSYSAGGDVSYSLAIGCDLYTGAVYRTDVDWAISGAHFMSAGAKYAVYTGIKIALRN